MDARDRCRDVGRPQVDEERLGRGHLAQDRVEDLGHRVRGLHRLQVETLATNTAMIQAAERVGFTPEGTLRQAAWVTGEFLDEVILGLLAADWAGTRT